MSTAKLTLIIASLAFALALAVTASAVSTTETQITSTWCAGQQPGLYGPHVTAQATDAPRHK